MRNRTKTLATARKPLLVRIAMVAGLLVLFMLVVGAMLPSAPWLRDSQPKKESPQPAAVTTSTADSAASVDSTGTHNASKVDCITCHLRPATHQIETFKCAGCHAYDDWTDATHPTGTDCASCHQTPAKHVRTTSQCSTCHKNAGGDWKFSHPADAQCATCPTPPSGHFDSDCATCHDPSIAWDDTSYTHSGTLKCLKCHQPPHKIYPTACISCHPKVGASWTFSHPDNSQCNTCHKAPSGHYGTNCASCHNPKTPWAKTTLVHGSTTTNCIRCHTPAHRSYAPTPCRECHTKAGVRWTPTAHPTRADCATCHSGHAASAPANCGFAGCHEGTNLLTEHKGSTCASCHESTRTEVRQAVSGKTTACTACHVGVQHSDKHTVSAPSRCATCHAGTTNLIVAHGKQTCAVCHGSADTKITTAIAGGNATCESCHGTGAHPHTATMNCTACHTPPHASKLPSGCVDCHAQLGVAWLPVTHPSRTDCTTCHTPTHSIAPPRAAACSACHAQATGWTFMHPAATSDCASCHNPPHTSMSPSACIECHAQSGVVWLPITHPSRADCTTCHVAAHGIVGTGSTVCAGCHAQGKRASQPAAAPTTARSVSASPELQPVDPVTQPSNAATPDTTTSAPQPEAVSPVDQPQDTSAVIPSTSEAEPSVASSTSP